MTGSVSDTAESSQHQALTFTMPAGSFASVLHYIAPIRSAQVQRHDATFQFTIPASVPGLAGTKVTVKVHDGGHGARHDATARASRHHAHPVPDHRRPWHHRSRLRRAHPLDNVL